MTIAGVQLIGTSVSSDAPARFSATAPKTGEKLGPEFAEASERETSSALELANQAALEMYGAPGARRAELLEAISEEILALGDALIERAVSETALPAERLIGERGRSVGQLKLFANYVREGSWVNARIDRADPERKPLPKPDVRSMSKPLGTVAVFGASNFPLAFSVAGGDTASALAAGCPVVVKAHPLHPGTSELVGRAVQRAVQKAGFHPGVFALLQGASIEVGSRLVKHPLTRAVAFTGSLQGGRALFDAAATRSEPIPVFAEMGSQNPVVVLPEAIAENEAGLADGLFQSLTMGVGQFCTNPGLVLLIAGPETERLLGLLTERVNKSSAGTMLGERIATGYRGAVAKASKVTGVQTLASGGAASSSSSGTPALLRTQGKTFTASAELAHEIFGPCTLAVVCDDAAELERLITALSGQLTATLHATPAELERHPAIFSALERRVGRVIYRGYPTGVEVCHAMQHGGPYPATTDARFTSVGSNAVLRFVRPVAYQNIPSFALPPELRNDNPCGILRLVDGQWTREAVT